MKKTSRILFSIMFILAITTGFAGYALADDDDEVYEARLIPCVIALCGADSTATLHEGEVEVTSCGQVKIEIESSSLVNSALSVSYQPFNGVQQFIGTFITDDSGDADDDVTVGILDTSATMGMFIISDANGIAQYITAFSTSPNTSCPDDNDCDGDLDDTDEDDDNDGVPDIDDDNPNSANVFDGAADANELKASYKQKVRDESLRIKAQSSSLKNSLNQTKGNLRNEYNIRATELSR